MSGIKSKLMTFLKTFLSHPACVSNVILLSLTTGFEQAWEAVAFKCPNDTSTHRKLYSVVSIAAPAAVLFVLGVLGSNMAWRLCQGLKHRELHDCSCWNFQVISLRALLIPLTWGFVALIDGDFYACYFYLPECPKGSSSNFTNDVLCTKNIEAWEHGNKVESQLIGWVYLAVILGVGLFVVFCNRWRSPRSYFPQLYSNKLKKQERMLIEKLLQERADKDAKENVGVFMMNFSDLQVNDWESVCREYTKKEYEAAKQSTGTSTAATGNQDKSQATDGNVGETATDQKKEEGNVGETATDQKKKEGNVVETATDQKKEEGNVGETATDQKKEETVLHHSPLSEWVANHPELLKKYKAMVAEAQQQAQPTAPAQESQNLETQAENP